MHTEPQSSDPTEGTTLAAAPTSIKLTFDEAVTVPKEPIQVSGPALGEVGRGHRVPDRPGGQRAGADERALGGVHRQLHGVLVTSSIHPPPAHVSRSAP